MPLCPPRRRTLSGSKPIRTRRRFRRPERIARGRQLPSHRGRAECRALVMGRGPRRRCGALRRGRPRRVQDAYPHGVPPDAHTRRSARATRRRITIRSGELIVGLLARSTHGGRPACGGPTTKTSPGTAGFTHVGKLAAAQARSVNDPVALCRLDRGHLVLDRWHHLHRGRQRHDAAALALDQGDGGSMPDLTI